MRPATREAEHANLEALKEKVRRDMVRETELASLREETAGSFSHEASEESLPQLEARLRSNFPDPSTLPQSDGFRVQETSEDSVYLQLARARKRAQFRGAVGSGNPHTRAAGEFQLLRHHDA